MTRPNPHIALIYHYDLARALNGEPVDWQAIPVNVDAGREGGDLCRAAADFGKRRDLFAMPAPTDPADDAYDMAVDALNTIAAPVPPVAVEQPAVDPEPDTASTPVPASAANPDLAAMVPAWGRDRLRNRVKRLVESGHESVIRGYWPQGIAALSKPGHTDDDLQEILCAVRCAEAAVGAGWHPDDDPPPSTRPAIARALAAWADRDSGTAWFAASLIATFEQCRNADATFEDLVGQFTIEQAERLVDAAHAAQ